MNITTSDSFEKSNTIYQGFNVEIGKTIWSITYSHGKYNSVIVKKISPNPFRGPGKWFDTFGEAVDNYKSANLQNALWETKFRFEIANNVSID